MLLLLLACSPEGQTDWGAQREANGPCYRANLVDGLDETSTDELHDVYACLNQQDNLAPLAGLDQSMDATASSGDPVGLELARGVNRLPDHDLDVWDFAETGLAFVQSDEMVPVVEISVELLYARPYSQLDGVELKSGAALDAGVLPPALPVLRHSAAAILDEDLEPLHVMSDALEAPEFDQMAHTLAHLQQCPTTTEIVTALPESLGDAIDETRDASNDHWPDASGDSFRDMAESLLVTTGNDGRIALEHLADPARVILEDEQTRDRVLDAILTLEDEGRLDSLPPELLYLTTVNADGQPLQAGQDSALVALIRLAHDANGEMTCSLDLWVTQLSVTLPNLSVSLLELVARTDPALVDGGVDLMGTLLGFGLSKSVMREIARSGLCDVFDEQVADDLDAVDRFNDPGAGDLLVTFHELLEALYEGDESRIPELVDILATTHAFGASNPIEEVVKDVGTRPLVYSVLDLVPAFRDPEAACGPMERDPMTLTGLWDVAAAAVRLENGASDIERLAPVLQAALAQEETYVVLGNAAGLLQHNAAVTPTFMALVPGLLELDPELELMRQLVPVLRDDGTTAPLLMVAESPEVIDALGRAELAEEGPLPFYARLVIGGTLDAALDMLDWALDLLQEE